MQQHPASAFAIGPWWSSSCSTLKPRPDGRCAATRSRCVLNTNTVTNNVKRSEEAPPTSMEVGGSDSDGRQFKSAAEMWSDQVGDLSKKTGWYRQGVGYWEGVEASVDGVLGGYGHVNEPDIKDSEAFLSLLLNELFPRPSSATTDQRHLVALVTPFKISCCMFFPSYQTSSQVIKPSSSICGALITIKRHVWSSRHGVVEVKVVFNVKEPPYLYCSNEIDDLGSPTGLRLVI
ncbi:hypothetical protein TIFTF001_037073 [Ficus carica]|uniref:Alpha N-terminal protein methyltransferase 1 n=1 Tax=Ficus carica TaxID=3494 RepID=A0AA88JBQ4_FICCA|nr:hypothetical protein TIFTF001_037073 [Ficus carica]